MTMPPANHPIWPIIRMIVAAGCCCLVLLVTANNFDVGELKAAGTVGVASLAFDMLKKNLAKG
jgi:hypothetical protein